MKRLIRILTLAITLVAGLTTVSAQTVQVLLTPRIAALPVTVTSYLDDPLRYFNVQFIVNGAGPEGLDVFFDMNLTVDSNPTFYLRTREGSVPMLPLHLNAGANLVGSDRLHPMIVNRLETNVDYTNPINLQNLPEGNYQLCLDVYLWSDRLNPNRTPITFACRIFSICYSGSAPELVSPMAGAQIALNGAMVLMPSRRINFFWAPVISNCAGRSHHYKYKLKVVKVLNGQNYQDAIRFNPTVLSTEVRDQNYAVFDTLRDIKVQMERGSLYVAQVQAEVVRNNNSSEPFNIANDGKSQPMPFFWGYADHLIGSRPGTTGPVIYSDGTFGGTNINTAINKSSRVYGFVVEDESEEGEELEGASGLTLWEGGVEEVSELDNIVDEMKEQYIAGFVQDASTIASLTAAYPEERQYVPTPERQYVESDGYYTVPMTDDLEVSFMPSRHDALKNVSYAIELYDYIDGGVDSITAYEPLFREEIEELPESYSKLDSHELISRTLTGWGAELEPSHLYYLQLTSDFTVSYWDYSVADTLFYVNEMLAEHVHDTISREFNEDELSYSNGIFFQWGDDPEVPGITAPQWNAPVDRSDDDIYDPANHKLPATVMEVKKAKSFPVSWNPVELTSEDDQAEYEVNVYELKPGQTLDEAISNNMALVTRTLTDENEISADDKDFFKAFSAKKTYVMTLSTEVYSEENYYHFENGNAALPIVIKIVK